MDTISDHLFRCAPPFVACDIKTRINSAYGGSAQGAQGEYHPDYMLKSAGFGQSPIPDGCSLTPIEKNWPDSFQGMYEIGRYRPIQEASGSHHDNATSICTNHFPGRLIISDGNFYYWNDTRHELVSEEAMCRYIGYVLPIGKGSMSIINGTYNAMFLVAPSVKKMNPVNTKVYFRNGYIDYSEQQPELKPHDILNFNTYTVDFDYNPLSQEPVEWTRFLNAAFEGDLDIIEKIRSLQETMAWPLITDNLGIQKAVTYRGAKRAGKGTALEVLTKTIGEEQFNSISNLSELTDDKVLSSSINTNMTVDFDAKKVPGRLVNETIGIINKMTANEPISIKLLYVQTPWRGRINSKLYLACNALPIMIDDSGAIAFRLHQIMFNNSFAGREDPELLNRLMTEKELIGNWMLKGLERLIKNRRFTLSQSSIDAYKSATESSQPLTEFIDENLIVSPDHNLHRIHVDTLFEMWKSFCMVNGMKLNTRNQFKNAMEDTLRHEGVRYTQVKINGKNKYGFLGVSQKLSEPANMPGNYVEPPEINKIH